MNIHSNVFFNYNPGSKGLGQPAGMMENYYFKHSVGATLSNCAISNLFFEINVLFEFKLIVLTK